MKWGQDLKIELELVNDSVYVMDVKELHHSDGSIKNNSPVYYPVSLRLDFIEKLKGRNIENESTTELDTSKVKPTTLWSAIHKKIGGGWIHFINCMLYSLETKTLDITSPLMVRSNSKWRPKPMTQSFKRTKKWNYYIPVNQKLAIKEYKVRKKNDELGDIKSLPKEFIELFLNTSDSDYQKLITSNNRKQKAKIELVKVLLGANYLSQIQIDYISNAVLKSAIKYSATQLPSVIILDDLNAAVAMSLSEKGYQVEEIVFSDEDRWTSEVMNTRRKKIYALINNINEINKRMFEQRLKTYYN